VLKFVVFKDGHPASELDTKPCYLIGTDEVSLKGQIKFDRGLITCQKTGEEAAALAVMWEIKGAGKFLLQTTRLPERDKPYILNVELARWRLMRILQKLEDWGLFDYPRTERITDLLDEARKLFVRALQNTVTPAKAADLADQALQMAMEAGEILARFHAARMLHPRLHNGGLGRKIFGCRIHPDLDADQLAPDILSALNFVQIPVSWGGLYTARQQFNFAPLDRWFEFMLKRRVTLKLGTVLSFAEKNIPPWLKGRTVDFELLRELVYEYLTAFGNRYGKVIRNWTVLSGIHADNGLNLSFEQVLDLTRLVCSRAKQLCSRAAAVVEITHPWGEYEVGNARTIHPYLYADMVSQSGVNFDAFSLRLPFGTPNDGRYLRDFFQLSTLIDRYVLLGKPLHVTTCVPSQLSDDLAHPGPQAEKCEGGYWDSPWSPEIQARWFEVFSQIVLSKPQVESVTWDTLCDEHADIIPYGGLFTRNWTAKPVFASMRELQKRFTEARNPRAEDEE